MTNSKFMQRLEERRKAQEAATLTSEPAPIPEEYRQFIPDVDDKPTVPPEQQALDDFISILTIVDAYNRWASKGQATVPAGRHDSIKVRCPNPAHPDKNPSAWLNVDKNVYYCGACSMGGDLWDIAAWHFGFSVPGYKKDAQTFRLLREKIGEDFGMVIEKGIAGDTYLVSTKPEPPVPLAPTQSSTAEAVAPPENSGAVSYTPAGAVYSTTHSQEQEDAEQRDDNKGRQHPGIDWRNLVPSNTFLSEYLSATTVDDVPEEFHFWNGLVAVGLSVGTLRTLEDSPEVFGNLYVCLVGGTGTGKSKSNRHLVQTLLEALPYSIDDQPPYGVNYIKGTQSGEYLIKNFQHPIIDPVTNKPTGFWPGIKGCVHFDELADLVGKAGRQGSTLKTTLMELYDGPRHLTSGSLTHGTVRAEQPFGSVVTTTQYASVRQLITRQDDGSGFANRWVYATGVRKRQFSVNRARVDLTRAISKLTGLSSSVRSHELVTWSDEAEKIWDAFYHDTYVPFRDANSNSSIIQRLDLLLKKLFLLFAINEQELTLSKSIVNRVLTLYPYLLETYGRVEQEISATQEGDEVDRTLRSIRELTSKLANGRGPTARELHLVLKRNISSLAKLRKILENLVVLGLIEEQKIPPGPKGGRPTSAFIVVNDAQSAPAGGANSA